MMVAVAVVFVLHAMTNNMRTVNIGSFHKFYAVCSQLSNAQNIVWMVVASKATSMIV
jgi:hypothetical protein